MNNKISVVIATYNGEKYITEQINSILKQIGNYDQVIISDDCSSDKTCEIIKGFDDSRIILIENKENIGVINNFEKTLERVNGDYIFLCDQDDVWLPNKVEVFCSYLKKYHIVQSDAFIVDESLKTTNQSYFELRGVKRGFFKNLWKNNYMGCNMAFQKKILTIALPFPKNIPMHDLWIGLIGELFFKPVLITEKLLLYRRHSSNVSQSTSASPFSLARQFIFRFNAVKYLPLLFLRKFRSGL